MEKKNSMRGCVFAVTCEKSKHCYPLAMSLLCQIVGLATIIPRPGGLSLSQPVHKRVLYF